MGLVGLLLFPVGVGFNALAMRSEIALEGDALVSRAGGDIAGALQFTSWKTRHWWLSVTKRVGLLLEADDARNGLRAGRRLGLKMRQLLRSVDRRPLVIASWISWR